MGYIYGNTIKKSGGNPWRTFLTASVSSTNDTTTFSGSMGMNPYDGWIKSGKRVYSLAGTGQTTVSKTQSDVKLASGSHTVQKSATWSWARGTTAQTKTITATTNYTGSNQDGKSTATYTVTVPALPYFTLTFNANGGSSTSTRSVQYKSTASSFPSVSRTGYTFNGWYTASSGGSRVTSITMPASNYTLYAQWTIVTYYVYFNAQGGTAPATQSKTYGSSITLNSPTRSGWTFKGWATSANTSTVSYAPGATYSANATTTLYAVWQKNVTLSFDANQGTGAPESQSATIVNPTATSATITISNTAPTRTNYKFTGWQLGSDTYVPGSNITISDNTTLTAVWQLDYIPPQYVGVPTAYRVSYDSDEQAYVFDDTGTYGYLEFAWTDGSMGGEPITTETATAKYQEHGASTWTNIAGTVANNKFTAVFGGGNLSTDLQYDIVVSVQNEGHDANTNTTYISTVAFTIDINRDGTAVSFFAPASDNDEGVFAPPMDTTELNDFIDSLNRDFRGSVDWIVEEGTSGNWSYIKYANGFFDAWGIHSVRPTSSSQTGYIYYSNAISVPFPFTIISGVATGTPQTNAQWLMGTSCRSNEIVFILLRALNISTTTDTPVSLMVKGRWK